MASSDMQHHASATSKQRIKDVIQRERELLTAIASGLTLGFGLVALRTVLIEFDILSIMLSFFIE